MMRALEQIIKLPLKKKAMILLLMTLLIGVAFWFFYYSPRREELSSLKDSYERLEQERTDANRRKATYEKDRAKRDELKKSYGQQLRALPSETEMSSFLNSLNTQAELVGLEIASVKPEKEEIEKYYAKIPVRLKLTGTYYQLTKFFYLVGNLDRIINLENISLKIQDFEETNAVLSAEVLATTFRSVVSEGDDKEEKSKLKSKKKKKV